MPDDFLGRGWPFPVRPDPGGALSSVGGEEKIRESIWLVLATAPGERLMRPDFGCGVHELVFQANTAALRGLVHRRVLDALTRWEPRIDVLDVAVESEPDTPETLLIRVVYRIRVTNALGNLVYPFFLTEGPTTGG